MKNLFINFLAIAAIGAFAFWALSQKPDHELVAPAIDLARDLANLYDQQPALVIALFCLAHLAASLVGIPGGCTTLNLFAGAIFGFLPACAIVYSITLVSAVIAYWLGTRLRGIRQLHASRQLVARLSKPLSHRDFLFLVSLRLSPLLPYGILNLLCGALHIPMGLYFTSTLVGIFFDVTVLTSLGAALAHSAGPPAQRETGIAIAFIVLIGLVLIIRFAVQSAYTKKKSRGERSQ